jgi:hypothetical protein
MTFTFTDSQERTYPDIIVNGAVLVAEPGQSYDLDADPADGRWATSASPVEAPQTAPEAPVADATPTTDPTTPTN